MSGTSITIKGETIALEDAQLSLDSATILCRYSERLAAAFTGWMPVDVQLHLAPCKFPLTLRVIDVHHLQQSKLLEIEFDGPTVTT